MHFVLIGLVTIPFYLGLLSISRFSYHIIYVIYRYFCNFEKVHTIEGTNSHHKYEFSFLFPFVHVISREMDEKNLIFVNSHPLLQYLLL